MQEFTYSEEQALGRRSCSEEQGCDREPKTHRTLLDGFAGSDPAVAEMDLDGVLPVREIDPEESLVL